jgi:5-hydroxyisourate hydrolase
MASPRSPITCHALDAALGKPAASLHVKLSRLTETHSETENLSQKFWTQIAEGTTDSNGRCEGLLPPTLRPQAGTYRIVFDTGDYFAATQRETFYPVVEVIFQITKPEEHHHVPLLLSPWSYTTYRGS